jgi:hypothetical protein
MNALGLGAFDASGATDWLTLSLQVPINTKSVEFNIGVSNVADNLFDSEVVVDQAGEYQCDQCGDCTSCPADPMCQDSCRNPPMQSCAFYRTCAEGQLGCGDGGYPLHYGEKNCLKFSKNQGSFTANGQSFIWNTMICLQRAMVPVLEPCTATCDSFSTAAFNSHPGCYVQGGFCGLGCGDIVATLATVGNDLFEGPALQQAFCTTVGCAQNLGTTLSGCLGTINTVFPALGGSVTVILAVIKVLTLFKNPCA